MRPGDAGGNRVNTAVGYGLTASLFIFGWILLGTMLLLNEIFGGADVEILPGEEAKSKAA